MKLLKLEILNLASLDNPEGEVINFEEGALRDSTIFSIVGTTGSGKSTILDAICIALYNRAPRYPRRRGERNQKIEVYGDPDETEKNRLAPTDCRNILTRGTKYGYSKLTFLANNGVVYRAEWSVRFKLKKYDDAVTSLYSISVVNGELVEKEEDWNQLPMIIGLDYDQFLSTVLIAQGAFSDFLNAKEEERYVLLEKLVGNEDLYVGIAAAIKKQKDAAVAAYNEVTASVAAYKKDFIENEDELAALADRIKELQDSEDADKQELQRIAEALAWYVAEKQFNEKIAKYTAEYTYAEEELRKHKESSDRLQMHDKTLPAVEYYKGILSAEADKKKLESDLKEMNDQRESSSNELEEKQTKQTALRETAKQKLEEHETQKPRIARARSLMGELGALRETEKTLTTALKDAEKATAQADDSVKDNEKAIVSKKEQKKEKEKAHSDLETAVKQKTAELEAAEKSAREKFDEENKKIESLDPEKLHKEKNDADNELADLQEALRITKDLSVKRSQSTAKQNEKEALKTRNAEIENELSALTIDELSEDLDALKMSYTLMTSQDWEMHRQKLHDGEACPLCGSTHHPYANAETIQPVIGRLEKLISERGKELSAQVASKSDLDKEKSSNSGKIEACDEAMRMFTKEITDLEKMWTELKSIHADWEQDVESLETMVKTAKDRCEGAQKRLSDYTGLTKTVLAARQLKDKAKEALDKYKDTSAEKLKEAAKAVNEAETLYKEECAKAETLKKQLEDKIEAQSKAQDALQDGKIKVEAKKHALKEEIGDENPDDLEKRLYQAVKDAESEVNKIADAIGELRETIKELDGKIGVATKNLGDAMNRLKTNSQQLDEWLEQYNAQEDVADLTVEDIVGIYSSAEDWESIRKRRDELNHEYTKCKTTLDNEVRAHEKHQEKKPEKTEEELLASKVEIESKSNTELVDSKARMQRHETAKSEMGALSEKVEKTTQEKIDWEQINEAIGGDGKTLRKIAQCYTLRFLIEHANVEIRKFSSKFELKQVDNSLGIRVIDHDRADDVRDTTSLSGGETFIVSLGLALGLSALSSRNISFENLFIDEGFGTLDPDTLAVVIDSLAMLQSSQGKKVGVISHTDTMSERITTQIRIVKKGNSGSSRIEVCP